VLHVEPVQESGEPELLTHPFPAVVDASTPQDEPEGEYAGHHRAHPVPEDLAGDTGARPARPVRHPHTMDRQDPE
jgi:hypothetical protein